MSLYLIIKYDNQSDFFSLEMGDNVVIHTDLLKGRTEDRKSDPYLRKSPSLESLSRPPSLGFGNTRLLSASTGGLKPSKLRYWISEYEINVILFRLFLLVNLLLSDNAWDIEHTFHKANKKILHSGLGQNLMKGCAFLSRGPEMYQCVKALV